MDPGFFLTPAEMIFLGIAVLVTLPFVWFLRRILRELRSEARADGAARKSTADLSKPPDS